MNQNQIENVAGAILNMLRTNTRAYDEWAKIRSGHGGYDVLGTFFQNELHLASKPTPQEFDAMDKHIDENLKPEMDAFAAARGEQPPAAQELFLICLAAKRE